MIGWRTAFRRKHQFVVLLNDHEVAALERVCEKKGYPSKNECVRDLIRAADGRRIEPGVSRETAE